MNKAEEISKLEKIIKDTEIYSDLNLYPNFQIWKKDIVDKRIKAYLKNASNANLDIEEGQKFAIKQLIKYQELKTVTEDIFTIFEQTEKKAREKLKKI